MEYQGLKPHRYSSRSILLFLMTFTSLLLFLYIINTTAFTNNYVYNELLMLGEKALLVFKGFPPRLENLGFVYPPFIYAFVLIFRNALFAAAFVGAICASLLLFFLYQAYRIKRVPFLLFPLVLLYILGSPASLFILSEQQGLCLFSAVFLQLSYHLYRYCRFHYTLDLFLFGMMTAILFFTRFQAICIIPLLVVPFLLPRTPIPTAEKLSIIIVAFFPSLFFLASWAYLNWIFMKDPLYFFKNWLVSVTALESAVTKDLAGALVYSFERIKEMLPLILPSLVAIARQIKIGYRKCRVSLAILASPFFMIFIDAFFGVTHEHSMSYSVFFLITALSTWMYLPLEEKTLWFDRLLIASLCVSFVFSWTTLSKHPEESAFIRSLGKPLEESTIKYAKQLVNHLGKEGIVLIDDARGFPIVYLDGNPRRFVLPYQYEYETVLSSPQIFARYVVVSSPITDRVAGRWPETLYGNLHGFKSVGRFGSFILYERTSSNSPGKGNIAFQEPDCSPPKSNTDDLPLPDCLKHLPEKTFEKNL